MRPSTLRGLLCAGALLAAAPAPAPAQGFTKLDTLIAMRDGVRLHTSIWAPAAVHPPLPFIFLRTPYGIDDRDPAKSTYLASLVADGYIFVYQDIRGRFKSEGKFVMQRPPRRPADARAIDESTDAYDTIDWLVQHVPGNNGRVGMLGVSYDGWLTAMAMLAPHPALKAVSPQASPADMFLGDDFHHNGAFRLSYGFEYAVLTEASDTNAQFNFDRYDTFDWYLALGALSNVNARYLHGSLPSWNDFVAHPNYDAFWQRQAIGPYLNRVTVPTLNVGGWWDQEDFYGPLKIYELLERHDSLNRNFLVVGPWNHGGWAHGPGNKLGNIDFVVNAGEYFRDSVQAAFFAHYLKDKPLPSAAVEYVVDLHTQDYPFLRGHRIMVQVQSTWFPIIDRNPQT